MNGKLKHGLLLIGSGTFLTMLTGAQSTTHNLQLLHMHLITLASALYTLPQLAPDNSDTTTLPDNNEFSIDYPADFDTPLSSTEEPESPLAPLAIRFLRFASEFGEKLGLLKEPLISGLKTKSIHFDPQEKVIFYRRSTQQNVSILEFTEELKNLIIADASKDPNLLLIIEISPKIFIRTTDRANIGRLHVQGRIIHKKQPQKRYGFEVALGEVQLGDSPFEQAKKIAEITTISTQLQQQHKKPIKFTVPFADTKSLLTTITGFLKSYL